MQDIDKALNKFKEETGYDFIEMLKNKKLVDKFFEEQEYSEEYLESLKELYNILLKGRMI